MVPVHKEVIKLAVIMVLGYHRYQLHTKFIKRPSLSVKFIHKLLETINVVSDVADQLLITYSGEVQ
jgi:hypothetical protein